MTRSGRPIGVTTLILFHLFNLIIWFFGQTLAIFYYDMVAEWGLQEPRVLVDPVIVEVNRAIAIADTILILPLFLIATIGLWGMRFWGVVASWIVLGWLWYFPLVFWSSQALYAAADIRHAPTGMVGILVPATLCVIAAWGIWYLYRNRAVFD